MSTANIRAARHSDIAAIARMRSALWPDATIEEHAREAHEMLDGKGYGSMPCATFVAEAEDGAIVGFLEAGLRSHADGCDAAHAVGYIEGWLVEKGFRRQGIGAALVRAAEDWSRGLECVEMASDTWIDNEGSQRAHEALGFELVDRVVTYRKPL